MATKKPATKRHNRTDFIGFILKAEKSQKLTDDFMKQETPEALFDFFKQEHFRGIPFDDCQDILKARDSWEDLTDEGHGKPPCDGPKRGY